MDDKEKPQTQQDSPNIHPLFEQLLQPVKPGWLLEKTNHSKEQNYDNQ